ncbi:hypothetical protein PQZ39_01530 [bacterium]|nr:hypothetical protein [bacterium]
MAKGFKTGGRTKNLINMKIVISAIFILLSINSYGNEVWRTHSSTDEMSGKKSWYASSPETTPNVKMDFPYADVYSSAVVACSNESYWSYLFFSAPPNLTGDKTRDGYNSSTNRVKWGEKLERIELSQRWGEKFLSVYKDEKFIHELRRNNRLMVELSWHGNPNTIFSYSLKGSSKAINTLEENCGPAPKYYSPQELKKIEEIKKEEKALRDIELKKKQAKRNIELKRQQKKSLKSKIESEIRKLPKTNFTSPHNKKISEVVNIVKNIMRDEDFNLVEESENAMKWTFPKKTGQENLNCGRSFGVKRWNIPDFYALGTIYTFYTDDRISIIWTAKGFYESHSNIEKCKTTGRIENKILTSVTGKKTTIKPKK